MSLFPRLRQACQGNLRTSADAAPADTRRGQGPSAIGHALCGHPPLGGTAGALQGQCHRLEINHLVLTGLLLADPQTDLGRNGEQVTILLVAFLAPDASPAEEGRLSASCEIEVPQEVIEQQKEPLVTGSAVIVGGQLTGGGGIIAEYLFSGPPYETGNHEVEPT